MKILDDGVLKSLFPSTSASLVIINSVFVSVLAPGLQKQAFQKTHLNLTCIVLQNSDMASLSEEERRRKCKSIRPLKVARVFIFWHGSVYFFTINYRVMKDSVVN